MAKRRVQVFPRFERMWHWAQVVLIVILMVTGFGLNGVHSLIPFGPAVIFHTLAALALLVLWIFATFWLFTTGTWKQFLPKIEGMLEVAKFYAYGVFKGEHHPYEKVLWRKHNPLQAATYFVLKWAIFPAIWISGIIYMAYPLWDEPGASGTLWIVANIHLLTAYVIVVFVIIHIYLLTVGHGFRSHVRPMVTGYDEIELTPEQEAYLEANEPHRIRPKGYKPGDKKTA